MTVMIYGFYGVHQHLNRDGLLLKLTPSALRLYLHLMERSEYFCSRELYLSDSEISNVIHVAPRSLTRDRRQLSEYGLVQSNRRGIGYKYTYVICDSVTGKPYPGDPKARIKHKATQLASSEAENPEPKGKTVKPEVEPKPKSEPRPKPEPVETQKPGAQDTKVRTKPSSSGRMTEHGVEVDFGKKPSW
jgi:hypothetical protein